MPVFSKKYSRGFTLIEVVAVLALISILSLVVLARQRTSNTNLPARTQVLKAHLRYAQSRAMNSDTSWGIQISGNSYRLINAGDNSIARTLPGEETGAVDLSGFGLNITSGDQILAFDSWGRPCSDASGTSLYGVDQALSLSDVDGNTNTITITKNTGFIP